MTRQTGSNSVRWRRALTGAVAGGAVAVGLMTGFGTATALADPADPSAQSDADTPPEMTADQALAIIAADYDLGAGGGQLSKLIHRVLSLRSQGYMPSAANRKAITKALDYRPNQAPLIEALEQTLSYQSKLQAQAANAQASSPATIGINQVPPGMPAPDNGNSGGIFVSPGGSGPLG